jgi:hypothetical protein
MSTLTINKSGTKLWHDSKGNYHRLDGPAKIWTNGTRFWYVNGERHRLDGPAVEWHKGKLSWYLNGVWLYELYPSGKRTNFITDDMDIPSSIKQSIAMELLKL